MHVHSHSLFYYCWIAFVLAQQVAALSLERGTCNRAQADADRSPSALRRRPFLQEWIIGGSAAAIGTIAVQPAIALTPMDAEQQYDGYASSYDTLDGGSASSALGIDTARHNLLQQAHGHVLEIGVGTGLSLEWYDTTKVTSLTLVDISQGMLEEARIRIQQLPRLQKSVPIKFVKADATTELIDRFGQESFDTVVDTFSLCVMGDEGAKKCLQQMAAVAKKPSDGGNVLLLENSRSSNSLLALYQDATADAAASVGGKGCQYNQDVSALIRASGMLTVRDESQFSAGLFRSYVCARTDP